MYLPVWKGPCVPKSLCLSRHTMPFETVATISSSLCWTDNPATGVPPPGSSPGQGHTPSLHAPQKERASYFITSMTILAIIYSNYGTCSRLFKTYLLRRVWRPAAPLYKPGRSEGECRARGEGGPPFPQPWGWSQSLTGFHPSVISVLRLPLPSPLFKGNGEKLFKIGSRTGKKVLFSQNLYLIPQMRKTNWHSLQ